MPQNLIRRRFLKTLPWAAGMLMDERASAQQALKTANGGSAPYPIPWLDKNGSHNQPAGPKLEPSHIYHFKGLVARCSTFTGMGTDNHENRIAFGARQRDRGCATQALGRTEGDSCLHGDEAKAEDVSRREGGDCGCAQETMGGVEGGSSKDGNPNKSGLV
jgi:hypothetical protein